MNSLNSLRVELKKAADPLKAKATQSFFKTGEGQYGQGDIFLGITVPIQKQIAKGYQELQLSDLEILLKSPIHEERFVSLVILVEQFKKGAAKEKQAIFDFYLRNACLINNWDLVDESAHKIVGSYLLDKNRTILEKLAHSENLWERRISIVATWAFILSGESKDTLKISEILLKDKHDLIQKATGWMLREMGKRVSEKELEDFLEKHAFEMPRTMLRYSIERFSPEKKSYFLGLDKGKNL